MAFDAEDGAPVGMERPRRGITKRQYLGQSFFFESYLPVKAMPFSTSFISNFMTRPKRSENARYGYYTTPVGNMKIVLIPTHDWATTEFSESDNNWS